MWSKCSSAALRCCIVRPNLKATFQKDNNHFRLIATSTGGGGGGTGYQPLHLMAVATTIMTGFAALHQNDSTSCEDESIIKYKDKRMNGGVLMSNELDNQPAIIAQTFDGKHSGLFDDQAARLDDRLVQKLAKYVETQDGVELFSGPKLSSSLIERETVSIARSHQTGSPEIKDIKLYITRPNKREKPCSTIVIQIHGGGMLLLSTASEQYTNCREYLTQEGVVVVGVEFENGQYPRGLNDCIDAVKWTVANKDKIMGKYGEAKSIVLFGDSGGANLALATAQALQTTTKPSSDDKSSPMLIDSIDGVYCSAPYIAGPHLYSSKFSTSYQLYSTGDYLLPELTEFAEMYKPGAKDTSLLNQNPLAWPLFASLRTLSRMPPHKISVNELDPLRDEGVAYHNKLLEAGATSQLRVVLRSSHCADYMIGTVPDICDATFKDIKKFCDFALLQKSNK